jgi:hypothetical protein
MDELRALSASNPALLAIRRDLDNSLGVMLTEAIEYGQALGPDADPSLDNLTDDEYLARVGRGWVD